MNQFRFNKTLKFSFGHVFALLALILISYISFMGTVYSTGGDFQTGGIVAGVVFTMLCILTYRIQLLKASEKKFARRIVWERITVGAFILACAISFIPFSHFWTVFARGAKMEQIFGEAIESSKKIFTDYEAYTDSRYERYEEYLEGAAKSPDSADYRYIKFKPGMEEEQIEHLLLSMELKHRSENYNKLRDEAESWIDRANKDVTTYNIFLLGNIEQIKEAISGWHQQLQQLTEAPLAKEEKLAPKSFDPKKESINASINALDKTRQSFAERAAFPNLYAWGAGLLLFALLSLPYHIQARHTKAQKHYGFWEFGRKGHNGNISIDEQSEEEKPSSSRGKMGKGFTLD